MLKERKRLETNIPVARTIIAGQGASRRGELYDHLRLGIDGRQQDLSVEIQIYDGETLLRTVLHIASDLIC